MHPDRDMHFWPFGSGQKFGRDPDDTQAHTFGAVQFGTDQLGRLRAEMADDLLPLHPEQSQHRGADTGKDADAAIAKLHRLRLVSKRKPGLGDLHEQALDLGFVDQGKQGLRHGGSHEGGGAARQLGVFRRAKPRRRGLGFSAAIRASARFDAPSCKAPEPFPISARGRNDVPLSGIARRFDEENTP